MPSFIAYWPDGTISVVRYEPGLTEAEYEELLFDDLDAEANPTDAKVYKLPRLFHIQTEGIVMKHKQTGEDVAVIDVTSCSLNCDRMKRFPWSPDIVKRRWAKAIAAERKQALTEEAMNLSEEAK